MGCQRQTSNRGMDPHRKVPWLGLVRKGCREQPRNREASVPAAAQLDHRRPFRVDLAEHDHVLLARVVAWGITLGSHPI